MENQTKHTPGPWGIDDDEGEILDAVGQIIGMAYHPRDLPLMAMAPVLLEALKELLALDEFDESVRGVSSRRTPTMDKARAAIAKAQE